jgi:hypothetical protein
MGRYVGNYLGRHAWLQELICRFLFFALQAGKLIEDAAFAYLYRNAIDIGAALSALPIAVQVCRM